MYTQEEYLYGWLFYLLGALLLMVCAWLISMKIKPRELKISLRLMVGVMLVVPWYASPELEYLAPAWIIAGFEGVFDGADAFWRAGTPLLSAMLSALLVSLGVQYAFKLKK